MQEQRDGLGLERVAALLASTVQAVRAEADAFGQEAMRWHPASGEWCVNEVIGHIMEAEERGFAGQIRRIRENPGRELPDWDPPAVTEARRDCERNGLELVAELETMRAESVRLVQELSAAQLGLSGEHPLVGRLRISELLHEWLHHDRRHLKQILSNVQASVWPNMGNAQNFS